jgi:hypothetical protein
MGSMRARLGRLMRKAERDALVFKLEDGSTVRFPPSAFLECLSHEWKRGREQRRSGQPVRRDAHPLLEALKKAKDPERLMAEGYGTLLMIDAENNQTGRDYSHGA